MFGKVGGYVSPVDQAILRRCWWALLSHVHGHQPPMDTMLGPRGHLSFSGVCLFVCFSLDQLLHISERLFFQVLLTSPSRRQLFSAPPFFISKPDKTHFNVITAKRSMLPASVVKTGQGMQKFLKRI